MGVRAGHVPLYLGGGLTMRGPHRATRAVLPWFDDSKALACPAGIAAVVTWRPEAGTVELWAVGPVEALRSSQLMQHSSGATLSIATREGLAARVQRLGDWLPVLWRADLPSEIGLVPVDAVVVGAPSLPVTWASTVEGPSLEAAALLSVVSWLADRPILPGFAISAGVSLESGLLTEVEHIAQKREGLQRIAPRLRLATASLAAGGPPLPFSASLSDAGLLPALLIGSEDEVEARVVALEDIAGSGPGVLRSFRAVSRGAELLLQRDLTPAQRTRVEFARAIVDRHDGMAVHMPRWEDIRAHCHGRSVTELLVQAVQHHCDRGEPLPPELLGLAVEGVACVFRTEEPCWPASIRLLGSLGRQECTAWTVDALRAALRKQIAAAEAWQRHRLFHELSYPLSEGFRLAGALADREAFHQVEGIRREWVRRSSAWRSGDRGYVDVARGRAMVLLSEAGEPLEREAWSVLAPIANRYVDAHPELVEAAARWAKRLGAPAPALPPGEQGVLAALDAIVLGRVAGHEEAALRRELAESTPWARRLPDVPLTLLTAASPS